MKKIYDAVVVTGEYQDRNGQTKKRYLTVGAVFQSDKGSSMKLECVPVGFNGWINFYEPKERDVKPEKPMRQADPNPFIDDSDIGF